MEVGIAAETDAMKTPRSTTDDMDGLLGVKMDKTIISIPLGTPEKVACPRREGACQNFKIGEDEDDEHTEVGDNEAAHACVEVGAVSKMVWRWVERKR